MRILIPVALCAFLATAQGQVNKITETHDGITFDSDYDNGSLRDVSSPATGAFDCTIYTESGEKGTRKYWFRFTMEGVSGRSLTLDLDHSENPRPFIRLIEPGPTAWRRLSATEAPDSNTIALNFSPAIHKVEIAFFDPLGVGEIEAEVAELTAASPYDLTSSLGTSFQGRDLPLVSIRNPRYPDVGKHRIWLHARAHAGEITASHTMLGFLEQVVEDSELGRQLREHCLFEIMPLLNVDGVDLGQTRWDAQGIDPESEWCDIRAPEVAAIKTRVDALMLSANPIELALNLHSTRGNFTDSFFFKHLSPSVTPAFEVIQQDYIDAFANATPLFANADPQSSQLNACAFIESYFWNNWGESVMALTHEGHFFRRTTDNAWITGADYRELGRAQAAALVEYFNLPASSEPDQNFASWQAIHFTAGESAISAPADDPDADGLTNLVEYAFATDPRSTSISPMSVVSAPEPLTVTFDTAQHNSDLTLSIEHSNDLVNWTREALSDPVTASVTTMVDVQLPAGTYIDRHTVELPPGRRFVRVHTELAP